jgi:excisionase family DNA binding protein
MNPVKQFYSIGETAAVLGASIATVTRRLADQSIGSVKIGGRRLILRESVDALVESATYRKEA